MVAHSAFWGWVAILSRSKLYFTSFGVSVFPSLNLTPVRIVMTYWRLRAPGSVRGEPRDEVARQRVETEGGLVRESDRARRVVPRLGGVHIAVRCPLTSAHIEGLRAWERERGPGACTYSTRCQQRYGGGESNDERDDARCSPLPSCCHPASSLSPCLTTTTPPGSRSLSPVRSDFDGVAFVGMPATQARASLPSLAPIVTGTAGPAETEPHVRCGTPRVPARARDPSSDPFHLSIERM